MENRHKYDDILHLSRPVIPGRAPMSAADRAAQFSPFAALSGYEEAIDETARLTDQAVTLEPDRIEELNRSLQQLAGQQAPTVMLTVFQPDTRKAGGHYRQLKATIKQVDACRQCLVLADGQTVPFQCIFSLEEA